MAKRLSKEQKLEIVKGFRLGKSAVILAKQFSCSSNTVTRTVKSILSEEEFLKLKEIRATDFSSDQNEDPLIQDGNQDHLEINELSEKDLPLNDADDFDVELINELSNEDSIKNDIEPNNNFVFQEISPLTSDFGFENRTQKSSTQKLSLDLLPETLYMLVDKKVELETKKLKDLPDWSFLPEDEQDREAISLFTNQRNAKRNCGRGQRVIKIANPKIFILSSRFLLSKGITRLVLDDLLIALEEEK